MNGPQVPADPAVSSLLSLVTLMADPEAAKAKLQEFSDAKAAADAAVATAADHNAVNAERALELNRLADDLAAREIAVAEREKQNAADVKSMSEREEQVRDRENAFDASVKQANADAAARDSALSVREQAVIEREAAAEAKHAEAHAAHKKHKEALEHLQAIVRD